MQFFMYSPLDMSIEQAFMRAQAELSPNHVVLVTPYDIQLIPPKPGYRLTALPGTYLVRVEQDRSLRIVHKSLD